MCVQFLISSNLKALAREYGAVWDGDFEWKPHVFPRYIAPVLLGGEKPTIKPMAFGLIPFFEKEEKPKMVFHNARVETAAEKPSFKRPFSETRCIVPIESFFEYVPGPAGKKRRVQFLPTDKSILSAAGIWSVWTPPSGAAPINCFSILTTEPPQFIKEAGHDRCPYFLRREAVEEWIKPAANKPAALREILNNGAAQIDWLAQ